MVNNGSRFGPRSRVPGVPGLPPPPGVEFSTPVIQIKVDIDSAGLMRFAANVPVPVAQVIGIFAQLMDYQCNYAIHEDSKLVGRNAQKTTSHAEIIKDLAAVISYHSREWMESAVKTIATKDQENGNGGNDSGSTSGNTDGE